MCTLVGLGLDHDLAELLQSQEDDTDFLDEGVQEEPELLDQVLEGVQESHYDSDLHVGKVLQELFD